MNNYQLYRTNLPLGGQMKWDIVIDNVNGKLSVSDFHLTPISNNLSYINKPDEYLLNNSHQDNIRMFYENNKGIFYNEGLYSSFCNNWPVIDEDEILYSNIYDMGCKRAKSYNTYKKQFEFFCPIWIEHLYDNLNFRISIKIPNSDVVLSSKTLNLDFNKNEFNDKFVKYFKNYINDAKLSQGCDDLMNISFNSKRATISGLNASTGLFNVCEVNEIIDNLTLIERPLLETDNSLIQTFINNTILSKQLFNFNLCFNIEDIFSGSSIVNNINGDSVSVQIDVFIGNDKLDKKDFYTNYEFINKAVIDSNKNNTAQVYNVLDYLHDYECIDLINKNKFCQSIFHWSLNDNNDYIFNVYNGFSGLCIDENIISEINHQYECAPNTVNKKYNRNENNAGWINTVKVNTWNEFYKYLNKTNIYKSNGTYINGISSYINGIKYNYIPFFDNDKYMISLYADDKLMAKIINSIDAINLYENSLYFIHQNDLLIFISNNMDNLTYSKFYDILYDVNSKKYFNISDKLSIYYLNEIYKMMNSKVDQSLIILNNTLQYYNVNGPSNKISEITYLKNNSYEYVNRYDGKIKPCFIDMDDNKYNILYYKDKITDAHNNKYINYIKLGYEPLYPSIDYCAIKSIKNWEYNKTTSEINSIIRNNYTQFEYTWFNTNKYFILKPEISFVYNDDNKTDESIEDAISKYLSRFYNIDDNRLISYIMNKYAVIDNWDYISNDNIDSFIHNITLKLK